MPWESGSRLGDYLLGEKLGQGGYGIVYAARDTKLDREIAVKILKPDQVVRPQVVKRFLQEARSAAKIVHPGIVTVYECGEVKGADKTDNTVFIAMEMLTGEPLGRRLKRGRISIQQAIDLATQVASALESAHEKGIVHRDLKPDNLYLVPDDSLPGGERIKVLDFGIAKLADAEEVTNIHTNSMMMMGTPKYMSPEQCRSTATVAHRSDIYSLGCILFAVLTGRTPFVGDAGEQIAKHQLEATPSTRALAPDVPKELDKLVVKMLAKKPEDRPASMAKVHEQLQALGEPAEQERAATQINDDEDDRPRTLERGGTMADMPSAKAARRSAVRDTERHETNNSGDVVRTGPTGRLEHDKTTPDMPRLTTEPVPPRPDTRERASSSKSDVLVQPFWRRRDVLLGAAGIAVLAVVIVAIAGRGGSSDAAELPPAQQPAAAPPTHRPADPPPPRAPQVPAPATSCDVHVTARAWDELMTCADQLGGLDAAKVLRTQAVLEARNRDSLTRLIEAIARKDHAEALVWLDRVDDTSVYRDEAVAAFAAALPRPEAALPTCNAAIHTKAAKDKLGAGAYREALVEIEASLRCATDPSLYRLGALAACNARNPVKARMFLARLPAGQQTTIRQICLRNGVPLP